MADLIVDRLVNYTKSRLNNKTLTYSYRKGQLHTNFRKYINQLINEVDDRLDGIKFRKIKPSSKTDVIIGYGDLPPGAVGAAVWNDTNWEIRLPINYLSAVTFRHELGHVLGLGHVPQGTKSLMQPSWGGFDNFTGNDWKALNSIWG